MKTHNAYVIVRQGDAVTGTAPLQIVPAGLKVLNIQKTCAGAIPNTGFFKAYLETNPLPRAGEGPGLNTLALTVGFTHQAKALPWLQAVFLLPAVQPFQLTIKLLLSFTLPKHIAHLALYAFGVVDATHFTG